MEIFPNTAASWGNLALAYSKLEKKKEAKEAIRRAIQLEPTDPRNRAIEEQISSWLEQGVKPQISQILRVVSGTTGANASVQPCQYEP